MEKGKSLISLERKIHKTFIFTSKLYFSPSQTYWPPENECTATARGGISPTAIVSVSDMQGSFFTLLIGIVMSFIVLGGELCCGKGKRSVMDNSVKTFTP